MLSMLLHNKRIYILLACFSLLSGIFLTSCVPFINNNPHVIPGHVIMSRCQAPIPGASITKDAPISQTIYLTAFNHIYAVNTSNGAINWCQQVISTAKFYCPPGDSCPAMLGMLFGTPAIANNTIYICASGNSSYTYALNIRDGSVLWRTATDCSNASDPFASYGTPMVVGNIIYDGTYALRATDGKALWRITGINTQMEFEPEFQALVGNILYTNTQNYVYAINASDGKILWRYTANTGMPIGGSLVVSGQMLYVGTLGSVNNPQASRLYALDTRTGKVQWQYAMGNYLGAVVKGNLLYVSSSDQHLYAFAKDTGQVIWKHKFAYPTYNLPTISGNSIYMGGNELYKVSIANGTILWHKALGQQPNYTPAVVANNVVYVATMDTQGHSILYALNASTGEEYWHRAYPYQSNPLVLA